jgi:hypothetical protein
MRWVSTEIGKSINGYIDQLDVRAILRWFFNSTQEPRLSKGKAIALLLVSLLLWAGTVSHDFLGFRHPSTPQAIGFDLWALAMWVLMIYASGSLISVLLGEIDRTKGPLRGRTGEKDKTKPSATLKEATRPSDLLWAIVGLGMVFGLPTLLVWEIIPNSIRYPVLFSLVYSVHFRDVQVDKKPADCDWGHAPLGDKGCHYEKQVQIIRNERGIVTDVYVNWDKVPD